MKLKAQIEIYSIKLSRSQDSSSQIVGLIRRQTYTKSYNLKKQTANLK